MIKKRILLICSYAPSLTHFRGDFIKDLISNSFDVFCAAPDFDKETENELKLFGATTLHFPLGRTGLNPFKDLQAMLAIKKIIKTNKIDIVFPYTIKPVLYGSMAANQTKTAAFSLITGLGYTFSATNLKSKILQKITETLYKLSIRKNKVIIFQNRDDRQLFIDRGIISAQQKYDIVNGSGVNLSKYNFRVNENTSDKIIFVFVARLIREKGTHLFIEAAKVLKSEFPNAEFHVIGSAETSPSAIKLDILNKYHNEGVIVYHGRQKNVPEFLSKSDIFVLPTYYREGIPRSILEALSVGMPVITTNTPGCRETVKNHENGFLIQPQDQNELISAMEYFLKNPKKIKEMGLKSRELAENKFDVNIINNKLIEIIKGNY